MIAVELQTEAGTPVSAGPIAEAAGKLGVMVLTAGADGNLLRFLPSLVISPDEQLDDASTSSARSSARSPRPELSPLTTPGAWLVLLRRATAPGP